MDRRRRGWPRGKRVKVSGQVMVKHDRPNRAAARQPDRRRLSWSPAGTDLCAASQRRWIGSCAVDNGGLGRAPLQRFRAEGYGGAGWFVPPPQDRRAQPSQQPARF